MYDNINSCDDKTFTLKSQAKFHDFFSSILEEDSNIITLLNETYTVIFAIKQNYNDVKRILYDVSLPDSPNYQNYLSRDDIGKISSNPSASNKVINILQSINGINIINKTIDNEYITVQGNMSLFEYMFNSKFVKFSVNGKVAYRMKEYSLPLCIHNEVAIVYNIIDSPASLFMKKKKSLKDISHRRPLSKSSISSGAGSPTSAPTTILCNNGPYGSCIYNENITLATPQFVSNLYSIKSDSGSDKMTQGCFETSGQTYSLEDIATFANEFNLPDESSDIINIGGGYVTGICPNANDCGEANLDLEYITAIAQKVKTTAWYVDDTTSDPFSSWIVQMANSKDPPYVMSLSYGTYEGSMSSSELEQWDQEAMKLGTQGVSIIVSAGDSGVAGYLYQNAKISSNWQSYCGYGPQFPATSPYVTTVGGTQGGSNEKPSQCDSQGAITTGGGFSNYYSTPSFQQSQVNSYFQNVVIKPYENTNAQFDDYDGNLLSGTYNKNGRAYPDVAAWSSFVYVVISGSVYPVAGTSVAAPVFAGMVSLTNSNNHDKGKRTMGWLNPFLYQYSANFVNDITTGNNKGLEADSNQFFTTTCNVCEYGFFSSIGYDPVTGLGTINYEQFSTTALSVSKRIPLTSWQISLIVIGAVIVVAAVAYASLIYYRKRQRVALTLSSNLQHPINDETVANPIATSSLEIRNRIEV